MTTDDPTAPEPSDHATVDGQDRLLQCGASTDELLEQAADGHGTQLTPHQSGCAYCQAALAEFTALWSPVARAGAESLAIPAGIGAALTAAVMADLRGAPAPIEPGHPVAGSGPGVVRWVSLVAGAAVIVAVIVAIVLLSHHHSNSSGAGYQAPTVATTSAAPTPTISPNPESPSPSIVSPTPSPLIVAPTSSPTVAAPTAVPAGTGGQAAATPAGTRHKQIALLTIGFLLAGAGFTLLLRGRRLRR